MRKREHRFLIGMQNQAKRHEMHPGNYPECPPFQEHTKRRRQPLIEGTQELLLTLPLRQLASTLVMAFCRDSNPPPQVVRASVYHSATEAVRNLYRESEVRG